MKEYWRQKTGGLRDMMKVSKLKGKWGGGVEGQDMVIPLIVSKCSNTCRQFGNEQV